MQTWSSTVLSHRPKYVRGKKHTNVCMYVYIYTRTHTSYRHQWSAYIHTFTYTYIMHTSIPAHTSAADTSGQSKQRSSPTRPANSRRIQTHQAYTRERHTKHGITLRNACHAAKRGRNRVRHRRKKVKPARLHVWVAHTCIATAAATHRVQFCAGSKKFCVWRDIIIAPTAAAMPWRAQQVK